MGGLCLEHYGDERRIFDLLENYQGSGASEAPQEAPGSVSRGFEEASVCGEVVQDILVGPKYITFKNDPKIGPKNVPKMVPKWSLNGAKNWFKNGSQNEVHLGAVLGPSWDHFWTIF